MFALPLTSSLPSIFQRVTSGPSLLVLLDYDGTLAPFETDPDAAQIPQPVRVCLRALSESPRATVGIVSGRSMTDLVSRVGLDQIVYAGNHGIEIRGRDIHFVEPAAYLREPALKKIVAELLVRLRDLPHVRVENKRFTATVHLLGANAEERTQASEIVLSLVHGSPQFRCLSGHDAFDIVPQGGWHKGTAAHWIQRELGLDDALVIYAGDDVSDEDAFAALPGAITIKIGATPTQASYFAESPSDMWVLLAQLEGILTLSPGEDVGVGMLCHGRSRPDWK